MKRTHRSLYYLVTYLVFAGVALMVAPGFALRLLLSNGDYGDVLPRLLGVVLLALGILVFRIVQLRVEALYPTTLIVRGIILVTLAGLYLYARDPFFLVLIGVVGLGVVFTGLSYWRDRQGSQGRPALGTMAHGGGAVLSLAVPLVALIILVPLPLTFVVPNLLQSRDQGVVPVAQSPSDASSEQKFEIVFEKAPFSAALARLPEGILIDVNAAFERAFGYTRQEALGKTSLQLGINPDEEGRARTVATLQSQGHVREMELTLHTKAGEARLFLVNIDRVEIGGQSYVLTCAQDITERKRDEETIRALNAELEQRVAQRTAELQAANAELEAFSYSVAHDLRAPLRSIDGFSRMLLTEQAERLDEEGKTQLQRVRDSAQHMGRLIDDLLALSRVSRGELRREHVDLTSLARSILLRLQQESPERQAQVRVEDGLSAHADARLLGVVLENLVGNAWKFSRQAAPARIEVGGTLQDGQTVFFVRDNGAGFDMEYANKLFGVFQRLHSASEFEGTGIGLATVQRIVRRHGGRAWAEGLPGKGATFSFTIPDAPA